MSVADSILHGLRAPSPAGCSGEVETILKPVGNQHGISVFPLSFITPTTKEKPGLQESVLRARFVGRFQQSATFLKVKAEMWFSQLSAA